MLWRTTHPALHAIAMTTVGFFFYSLVDTSSKWLTQFYSPVQTLFGGSIFAVILGIVWMYRKHGARGFITKRWRWQLTRGISIFGTAFCVVNALSRMPLADFYSIVFLSPLLVSLFSALLFKETIGAYRLVSLGIGFIGVLLIAGPQFEHLTAGFIFAFASMLLITSNLLLVRKIGDGDPLPLYFLYPFLCNIVFTAPYVTFHYTPVSLIHALMFMGVSILLIAATTATALGYSRAPESAIVAPFHYTQMIWGVLIGFFLFGDVPSLTTMGGASLIIGSGLWVIWHEHRRHIRHRRLCAQEDSSHKSI